ncbi:MAG: hypothetical protein AAF624_06465 [Bacteroidota bacterium]
MKRCAFLTMADPTGFVIDDDLAVAPLAALGWHVDRVPWTANADWDAYDLVIVRSPWDYQHHADAFLAVLAEIEASAARLENPLALVRWNLEKGYLRDLEADSLAIVPTAWSQGLDATPGGWLDGCFGAFATDQLIVKPTVSANADDTFWLTQPLDDTTRAMLASTFADRACMVQPFVPAVLSEGEFSLFYFAGGYSHTILKTPKPQDFRVQEEHGGLIRAIRAEPALREQADAVMATLHPAPLYARVDFVRLPDGTFAVMEVELIEPALYLRMDADAPERFAHAVDAWMQSLPG